MPLTVIKFDRDHHVCDHCGRTLKDGAVVLSDDRRVGRDCAATAMGKPRKDRDVTEAIDTAETAALRALWDVTLEPSAGTWRTLRFTVPARPVAEGGPGGSHISAFLTYAGTVWIVSALPDGRIIGTAPKMQFGRKVNTKRPTIPPLCAGPLNVRYYDLTPFVADFAASIVPTEPDRSGPVAAPVGW